MTRKPEAVDLNRFVGRTTDDDPWRSEPRSPAGTPSARPTDGRCEGHDDRVAEHRDQVKPKPIRVVGSEDPAQISACRRTSSAMEETRVPVARVSYCSRQEHRASAGKDRRPEDRDPQRELGANRRSTQRPVVLGLSLGHARGRVGELIERSAN